MLPNREMLRLISYPHHDEKDFAELLKESFELTIMLEKNYPGLETKAKVCVALWFWLSKGCNYVQR